MSRQYQVRADLCEVFCNNCANEIGKELENLGLGEIAVEINPISTLRRSVKCGRCNEEIFSDLPESLGRSA
jgi:copper chaperone CopZ